MRWCNKKIEPINIMILTDANEKIKNIDELNDLLEERKFKQIVKLLKGNTDAEVRELIGELRFYWTDIGIEQKLVEYLTDRFTGSEYETVVYSVLHAVVYMGNISGLKYLIDNDVDITHKYGYNQTIAHVAAERNHVAILEILAEHNFDFECEGLLHSRPLHMALENSCIECIDFLIDYGVSINAVGRYGSVLHYCVMNNLVDHAQKFIDMGCNRYIVSDNNTPLAYAAAECNEEIFFLMINNGFNIHNGDINQFSYKPLDMCILSETNLNNNGEAINIVKYLIDNGGDVYSDVGEIPLYIEAVSYCSFEIVELFIKKIVSDGASHAINDIEKFLDDNDYMVNLHKVPVLDIINQLQNTEFQS